MYFCDLNTWQVEAERSGSFSANGVFELSPGCPSLCLKNKQASKQ